MHTRICSIVSLVLVLALGAHAGKPKLVVDINVPNDEYKNGYYTWCRDGTLILWSGRSNDVRISVRPPGKPSYSVVLPETAGADRTWMLAPLEPKFIVAQVRKGAVTTFHAYKVTRTQLKPLGTYTTQQIDTTNTPRATCVDSHVFVAQQMTTTGVTAVRTLTRKLKEKLNEEMNLWPNAGGVPNVHVSPNGRYIGVDVGYDNVDFSYDVDFYAVKGTKLAKVGSSVSHGDPQWFMSPRDSTLYYSIPATAPSEALDALAPLQRLTEHAWADTHDSKGDAGGKPSVMVAYTNKTLRIFSPRGEMGPYQLTDAAPTDKVAIVYFRKRTAVLAFYQGGGPYSVYAYRLTRKGLKSIGGPVTGHRIDPEFSGPNGKYVVVNERGPTSMSREGLHTAPGLYYHLYTRTLKLVDTITVDDYSHQKPRTLLDRDKGASTTRMRAWSW
jgi:hypothetical protein